VVAVWLPTPRHPRRWQRDSLAGANPLLRLLYSGSFQSSVAVRVAAPAFPSGAHVHFLCRATLIMSPMRRQSKCPLI
jgi:hypothetical protein